MYAVLASVALMATAATAQIGSAVVINMCTYDVRLCNVPAADGGQEEYDTWLGTDPSNRTYSQSWTQLSNGDGWSIKLGQSEAAMAASNIMQYEYTYQGDDIIWYDLSDVNGNPWDGNWEITANSTSGACNPKQQAYRYATDDAYGMQACPSDSVITVTLCSGDSSDDSGAAAASSSVAAVTSSQATATSTSTFSTPSASAPAAYTSSTTSESTTSESTTSVSTTSVSSVSSAPSSSSAAPVSSSASATPSTTVVPTTFATSSTAVYTPRPGVTTTEVETAVVTDVVTATYWHHPGRRHEHHRRHGGA